ncbi:MAG: 16S rRNA (cytidine(1402)-2'-O)-methyltransferase [Fimbriimonadaceae bacterium]|nr:16S rRNA (cytidine(1402)-2'-O)-methyltransferase [Fimbriimonadaceae bacterium]
MAEKGKLILIATPIGNLGDLSPRAVEVLRSVEACIVEDTRISGKLMSHLSIKTPLKVLNEHTAEAKVESYAEEIAEGAVWGLITDGGTPGISDPGAHLVDLCHEKGVEVDSIPGPCAAVDALALSGFYAQRFAFLGFLPRKPGPIREVFAPFSDSPMTLVLFESPFRAEKLLEAAFDVLGPRRYAICRELTKLHQQVYRERLPNVPSEKEVPNKGEFTIVIEGKRRQ